VLIGYLALPSQVAVLSADGAAIPGSRVSFNNPPTSLAHGPTN
jgi:hypothetical protein